MSNRFTNNARGALASGIASGATSIALGTGQGALFANPSAPDYSVATIFQYGTGGEINHEIVRITARSGDTLTVLRGQEGTTARAFNAGDPIQCRVTAAAMNTPNPQKTTYGETAVFEQERDLGNSGASVSIAFDVYQKARITLNASATITLGTPAGIGHYQLRIIQDATGGRTPTWSGIASTAWLGSSSAPSVNTAASGESIATFYWTGSAWRGSIVGVGVD